MARLAIVTDSVCSIPQEMQEEYQITVVPLAFLFGETSYVDNVSLTWEEFYSLLKSARRLPSTASAPPGAFLDTFREAYQQGSREVLCIVTSSQLTATYNAACDGAALASEQMPNLTVKVIDSRSAAAALGFVVLAAARSAANGATLEEAASKAEALIPRLYMLGVLDTLDYLAKGGRVPQVAAWLSALLQVKPLFQFHDGQITRLGAVRTKPRAVARLLRLAGERLQMQTPSHVAVFHSRAAQEAEELAEKVREEFRPTELFVTEFSQVMSIHTGPGLVGLAFYNEL
jgi:DegV family protein with EDD domain